MKEKIYKFLSDAKESVSIDELVDAFFMSTGRNSEPFKKILTDMLTADARFIKDEKSEWRVAQKDTLAMEKLRFIIVDYECIAWNARTKIPLVLGLLELVNGKIRKRKSYFFQQPPTNDGDILRAIQNVRELHRDAVLFAPNAEEIYAYLQNSFIIIISRENTLVTALQVELGGTVEIETITLAQFVPECKKRSLPQMAEHFGLLYASPLDLRARLELSAEILTHALESFAANGVRTRDQLYKIFEKENRQVDFSNFRFNRQFISDLPDDPGVYLMKDRLGFIFYVGKARSLKSRVSSYFMERNDQDEKSRKIFLRLFDISCERTGSELDALLLEHRYINKYQPEVNTQIDIHPLNESEIQRKRLILFTPALDPNFVVLYFIDGIEHAVNLELKLDEADLSICEQLLNSMFFNTDVHSGEFTRQEIEIIRRWFKINHELVNYIDVDETSGSTDCMTKIKAFIQDKELMKKKLTYV